jgi:hypothetical protein
LLHSFFSCWFLSFNSSYIAKKNYTEMLTKSWIQKWNYKYRIIFTLSFNIKCTFMWLRNIEIWDLQIISHLFCPETISNYTRRSNKIQGNTYFHRLEPMEVYETIFHMFCNNTIQGNTYFHRLEVYETIFHMSCNNKIQGNTYFHRLEVVKSARVIPFRPRLFKWCNIVLSSTHQHSNDSNNSTMRMHSTTTLFILCNILFR